jgi:hypothetical protein
MRVVVVSVVRITLGEVFGTSERARPLGHVVSTGSMRDAGSRLPVSYGQTQCVAHRSEGDSMHISILECR